MSKRTRRSPLPDALTARGRGNASGCRRDDEQFGTWRCAGNDAGHSDYALQETHSQGTTATGTAAVVSTSSTDARWHAVAAAYGSKQSNAIRRRFRPAV